MAWLLQPAVSAAPEPTSPTSVPAGQWRKFNYDLASTGFNPRETILSPSNVGDLVVKWAFPEVDLVLSSPAVVDGVVYSANSKGVVFAVDAAIGTQIWSQSIANGDGLPGDITVSHGLLFVGTAPHDARLHVLEAATGVERWSYAGIVSVGTPTVVGNTVYVGTFVGELLAFRATDGRLRWRTTFPGGVLEGLAVAGGLIYAGDDVGGCVRAFDQRTGALRWSRCLGGAIPGTPTVAGGRVFVGARTKKAYALDARTGAILWTGALGGESFSSAAAAYGMAYIGSTDGKLYAFPQDCTDPCTAMWTFQTGDEIVGGSPAVANGVLYVGSHDNTIYALDAMSGTKLWSYTTTGFGWFNDAPAVLDGVLYAGSYDHNLYAFSLPSGS